MNETPDDCELAGQRAPVGQRDEQCVALTSSPVISDALVEQGWREKIRLCQHLSKRVISLNQLLA